MRRVPPWLLALLVLPSTVSGQEHAHGAHEGATLFASREASGTSWVPDAAPMDGVHRRLGSWEAMVHGIAFAQFLYEGGEEHRRSHQAGSINWLMAMARRPAGDGRVGLRLMLSAEPWTIGGCGYPDLLATGETCRGDTIHDLQHPHDLFMELAGEYQRRLRGNVQWQLYAGLAGEPALGPAAFPHRPSATANPIAPIAHHWLDATHISHGVVTLGVFTDRWKVEGSSFNGREPDERRHDLDLAALDSFSARLSVMPTGSLVVQASAGHLNDAEVLGSLPRTDVTRATASATHHYQVDVDTTLATTVAWGANFEPASPAHPATTSHGVLVESAYSARGGPTLFGRFEVVGKPAEALHVHESTEVFTVAKLQLGYIHHLAVGRGTRLGVGATVSGSLVPLALMPRYGGRITPGFGVFAVLRSN